MLAPVLIVVVAVFFVFVAQSNGLPQAEEVADRMAARLEQVRTVQGRLQLVNDAVAMEQELWVERPRRLRMEIEAGPPGYGPLGENQKPTLVLNEEDAWFYNPNLNLTTVTDRTDYLPEEGLDVGGSILESMPQEVLTALQNSSAVQIIGEEQVAGRSTLRLQILLADAENAFQARTLNVALDRRFYYPLLIEGDGGFVLRFKSVEFNADIDPATFVFVPPPGSTVNQIEQQE